MYIDIETHPVFQYRILPGPKGRALRSRVLKRLSFTVSKAMIAHKCKRNVSEKLQE